MWLMAPTRLQESNHLGKNDHEEGKKSQNYVHETPHIVFQFVT